MQDWEKDKAKMTRQIETAQDKMKLIKENKDREIKDLGRKLSDVQTRLKAQFARAEEAEQKLIMERDSFNQRLSLVNHAGQFKSSESSVVNHSLDKSSKSMQKNRLKDE